MFYTRFAKKIICLSIVGILVLNPVVVRASSAGSLTVSGGTITGSGSRMGAIAILMMLANSLGFSFHLSQAAKEAGETVSDWLDDQLSEWEALEQQKIDIIKQLSSGSSGGGGGGDDSGSDDSGGDKNKVGKNGKIFIAAGALAIAQKFFNWLKSKGRLKSGGGTSGSMPNPGNDLYASTITGLNTAEYSNITLNVTNSSDQLTPCYFIVCNYGSSYYLCAYTPITGLKITLSTPDSQIYKSYNVSNNVIGFQTVVLDDTFLNYPSGTRIIKCSGESYNLARPQLNIYMHTVGLNPTVSGSVVHGSSVTGFYDNNNILHKLVIENGSDVNFYAVKAGNGNYTACIQSDNENIVSARWYSWQNGEWVGGGVTNVSTYFDGKYYARITSGMKTCPEGLLTLYESGAETYNILHGLCYYYGLYGATAGEPEEGDESYIQGDYDSSDLSNQDGKYTEVDPQILPDMAEQVNGDTTIDIEEYLKAIIESINKKADPAYNPEQVAGTDTSTLESVPLEVPEAETYPSKFPEDQETEVEPPADAEPINLPDKVPDPEQALPLITFDLREYFPFCLPFDCYDIVSKFVADPVAPAFDIPFSEPFSGAQTVIHVDLSPFDSMMVNVRNAELIAFVVGLALITRSMFAK